MKHSHKKYLLFLIPAILLSLFCSLLVFIYSGDNKYTQGAPYGENGRFCFTEQDLDKPLFLVDGWILNGTEVFIGQYSNFSYLPGSHSAFGEGTYTLTLHYSGKPCTLLLEIPTIFTEYELYINGVPAASSPGQTRVAVPVGDTDTVLTLHTVNKAHYYSGLTYPPALGTVERMSRLFFIRTLLYTAVCFSVLTLALFSIALWFSRYKEPLFFHFGLLCLSFALHCAHPLIAQAGLNGPLWYAAEDASWLFVLAEALHLTALLSGLVRKRFYRGFLRPAALLSCLCAFLYVCLLLPRREIGIPFYGGLTDFYKLFIWACLCVSAGIGLYRKSAVFPLLLPSAISVLGVSVFVDVLDSNCFEPIYGLWQNEYAGVLLVFLFGCIMVHRMRTLLEESRELEEVSLQYRFARQSALYMSENARQVRTVRHELNHHIEALYALSEKGDLPRLTAYLSQLKKEKNALPSLSYSGNFLVNAILCAYLHPAQKLGISVRCRVLIPDTLPLPDAELCSLLSNLLQNALEACSALPDASEAFIEFEMSLQERLLSFSCKNSTDDKVWSRTTKADSQNHGMGLAVIRQLIEKRHGSFRAEKADRVFTARGILPLPRTGEEDTL